MVALVDKRSESERFSSSPINTFSICNRLFTRLEYLYNLWVESATIFWQLGYKLTNTLDSIWFGSCIQSQVSIIYSFYFSPLISHPIFAIELESFTFRVCLFHFLICSSLDCFKICLWNSFSYKLVTIFVSAWLHLINYLVHERLCEGWLIKFIVTELSVSNQVNDNILLEFLTVLSGKFECSCNIIHTISVNMENWGIDRLCDIRAVVS